MAQVAALGVPGRISTDQKPLNGRFRLTRVVLELRVHGIGNHRFSVIGFPFRRGAGSGGGVGICGQIDPDSNPFLQEES